MKLHPKALKKSTVSMLSRIFGGVFTEIAVDLGTSNTRIYLKGSGIVINEPTVIARLKRGGKIVAVGVQAQQMLGRAPQNIQIIRPLERGVISDFEMTQALITCFVNQIKKHPKRATFSFMTKMVIGVPAGVTEVERKAVIDAGLFSDVRSVYLVEKPTAAAIGAGLPVDDAKASMILDIGGGVTEAAVLSWQGIVSSRTVSVAGTDLDQAIVECVRDQHNLMIGKQTAEQLKFQISLSKDVSDERTVSVKGRDLSTGLPKEIAMPEQDIAKALETIINQVVEIVRDLIEDTPPELVADMVSNGLIVTGGGAKLRGFDTYLAEKVQIPVYIAERPELSVINGMAYILEHPDLLEKLQIGWGK